MLFSNRKSPVAPSPSRTREVDTLSGPFTASPEPPHTTSRFTVWPTRGRLAALTPLLVAGLTLALPGPTPSGAATPVETPTATYAVTQQVSLDQGTTATDDAKTGRGHNTAARGHGRWEEESHDETPAAARKREEDRLLAIASTWTADPQLINPRPRDSKKTKQARRQLSHLATDLKNAVAEYDRAYDRSRAAAGEFRRAKADLAAARLVAAEAETRYALSQQALATIVRGSYTGPPVTTMGLLLDDGSRDALADLSLAGVVEERQDELVASAAQSAHDVTAAALVVASATDTADTAATRAADTLAAAATSRTEVLNDVRAARHLLRTALATDAQAREEARLAAIDQARHDALIDGALYIRPKGKVSFPLPPNTTFRDNDNWGGSGSMWSRGHTGNDLSAACGTPVLAATNGVVEIRTDQSWSGKWLVIVSTGEGKMATWYAHMQALAVTDGQKVKAGQQIGEVGTLGNSTGCHLHFEYHPFGGSIYEDNSDPVAWWYALGVYPGQPTD